MSERGLPRIEFRSLSESDQQAVRIYAGYIQRLRAAPPGDLSFLSLNPTLENAARVVGTLLKPGIYSDQDFQEIFGEGIFIPQES